MSSSRGDKGNVARRIDCVGCGRFLGRVSAHELTLFLYCKGCGTTTQVFATDTDDGFGVQKLTRAEAERLGFNPKKLLDEAGKSVYNSPGKVEEADGTGKSDEGKTESIEHPRGNPGNT